MSSNAELHRQMDEALNQGDIAAAHAFIAEDIVNHVPGNSPLAGIYHGRDAFFEMFQKVVELTGGEFTIEHRDILQSDEHSAALSKMTASREGKRFEGDAVDVCRWKDGQVVEEWVIPFDQNAFDAFWG